MRFYKIIFSLRIKCYWADAMVCMPNIQQAFKPVEVISVAITLNNKCSVDDDSFAVAVPGTDIIFPFKKGGKV